MFGVVIDEPLENILKVGMVGGLYSKVKASLRGIK